MAKSHWINAAFTIAMFAAVPALAQRPEAGMTGPNGAPNPMATQPSSSSSSSSMAPADNGGSTSSTAADSHSTRHGAMAHSMRSMHGKNDRSQDAEVDRLNDQSYQAASQGQAFTTDGSSQMTTPSGMAPDATTAPSGK